jgi:hypothetical protein
MYQNKVTLIGFLGSNAEVRNNGSFTTLSLATKSSYKKNGEYISHTECLPKLCTSAESMTSRRTRAARSSL